MLKRIKMKNYRSFKDFTINFSAGACLVGPNNAGKSTILTALRLADTLLRLAHARRATGRFVDHGRWFYGHEVPLSDFPSLRESLRHEFYGYEARLELTWKGGNQLIAVWPEEDGENDDAIGFFYLVDGKGQQPISPAKAKADFPRIGIVPVLSPLDHTELILNDEYVRRNISTRLSSRHFRNQLHLLKLEDRLEEFRAFAAPWLPGVGIEDLDKHPTDHGPALDLFISEEGSRIPKEVIWAGDGIQVWFQILYHLFRLREYDVIVLDEPDVYLHADLQRRLVQVLESTGKQTLLATHSPEIVAEMPRQQVIWIDKSRRSATGIKDEGLLDKLTETIGSQFNLKLARAMRARVVVMVEGNDMQVFKRLAATLGASNVEFERRIAIISMNSYSKWGHVEPFAWILDEFLEGSVECYVILDRDYRPQEAVDKVLAAFAHIKANVHIWQRKELESYLLCPAAIARLSGETESMISDHIADIVADMENDIFARMLDEEIRVKKSASAHQVTITGDFKTRFSKDWKDLAWRVQVAPPKQVLSALNQRLQDSKHNTVSVESLARNLHKTEIPREMQELLRRINEAAE